jgi:hypothetical protein
LPAVESSPSFPVSWSGQDDSGGSGIVSFDIYVSDNGSTFAPWLTGTTLTSATYPGQAGHTYAFYTVATDNVGNREATPTAAQATTVVAPQAVSLAISTPTSATAGSGFLVTVQAEDASNNPTSNFSGIVTFTTTDPHGTVPASATITNGFGVFLATLATVPGGPWTITATSGSFTVTSGPIAVTPGHPARLGFAAQPANTPTGQTLPAVTVQVLDVYGNVVTSDDTDIVKLGIAVGPGTFTPSSSTTATVHNGVATFTSLALVKPGTYQLSPEVAGLYTGSNSAVFTVAPLQVLPGSFAGTATGFSLQLNAPFLVDSLTPALYGSGFGIGATVTPTVTLTQTSGTPPTGTSLPYQVPGSLIVNTANNSLTFVETDTSSVSNNGTPLLPDGTYVAHIISSGADGLRALNSSGGYLDGTNSGTTGNDFTATFTVGAAVAGEDVVWLPATADGPGQPLSAPGKNQSGGGYPVYLDDTSGTVTDVQATLTYNPALLTVTPTSTQSFTVMVPSAGTAVLHYDGAALPAGTQTIIGMLTAMVPPGTIADPTPYRAKDLLQLTNVSLNGGSVPVVAGNALHLVAYVGDADGNGSYSSNDAVLTTRVLLSTDAGFAAYPLVDPVIVADTDGAGFIPADAALQANEAGVGLPTANLTKPPTPPGVVFQPVANNVDPSISIPSDPQVGPDGTITGSVNIDDAHPLGSTGLIRGHLALTYDPNMFTVSATDVHPGSLLAGGDWSIVPTIDQTTSQIGIALSSSTPISNSIGGSLITIDFHPTGTISGAASFELVAFAELNGQYVATELEDAQGTFTLSPAPTNGFDPRIDGVVKLAPSPAAAPASIPGEETGTVVSPVAEDIQRADGRVIIESAVPNADTASIEGSEWEAPATPTAAAANASAAAHAMKTAGSSFFASMIAGASASTLGGLGFEIGGPSMGLQISASQRLNDQILQALEHWISRPADLHYPSTVSDPIMGVLSRQLLPVLPTSDSVDNVNWDELSGDLDLHGVGHLLNRRTEDTPAYWRLLPATGSQAVANHVTLDEYFSQLADANDTTEDELAI